MNSRIYFRLPPFASRVSSGDPVRACTAFTLIELIGVLAIMAIIAGAITPNVLKSIDRAAVSAEVGTVSALGDQVKKYLHDYGSAPALATWSVDIGTYSSISSADVVTNRRGNNRVYVWDAVASPTRALILSSMWNQLAIPAVTVAQFNTVWTTPDGQIPAGWGAAWANKQDYLVVQRVNFKSEFRDITLQNRSNVLPSITAPLGQSVNYSVTSKSGATILPITPLAAGGKVTLLNLVQDVRVNLYPPAGPVDYIYIVSVNGRTIDFNGTNWVPE